MPNLFVPGAAKSGTSSLHAYLDQHPDIFMCSIKEPHFFCKNDYDRNWGYYLTHFVGGIAHLYRGESSTGYMVFPHVVDRIKSNVPNPKFIFLLRNPVDRAYSHYWWLKGVGFETRSFLKAFTDDRDLEPEYENKSGPGYKYYYQFGLYGKWLQRFFEAFNDDRILVITTESLMATPTATMERCFEFLGLPKHAVNTETRHNSTIILKYPFLNYLLSSVLVQPQIKRVYQRIFSKKLRIAISSLRTALADKYIRPKQRPGSYPPVPPDVRQVIASHYKTDVTLLMNLTQLDFPEWSDFYVS